MIFNIFGTSVDLKLKKEHFPTDDELRKMDEDTGHPILHGFFPSSYRQKKLHYRKYIPSGTPKAICVWQHGIHDHSGMVCKLNTDAKEEDSAGNYTNMGLIARALTKAGFVLYAMDLLGHGFSEGDRFYIPRGDWTIHRNDLEAFTRFAVSEYPTSLPLFLMAESYGGTLALHIARKWQDSPAETPPGFKGLVLAAPAIVTDLPPLIVVWFLRYCLAPFFPKWTPFFMPDPLPAERNWKDEKVRLEFTSDQEKKRGLMADKPFSLGTGLGLLIASEEVCRYAIRGIDVPFAIAHGTNDEAVPILGTDLLVQQCATRPEDRSVKRVEGAFHDILSEADREDTIAFFIEWMNSRLK